ncbi:MAG: tetratricopeptide repeat protein [Desulfuromonadaceae bacterium]|nr:tetratricopeptide repeat protein [Desulfuromonadaceae bacterium]
MAVISKKDKMIEEAQKLVMRGQFEKAAKAYEQILESDPSAMNLRQKRAELLVKCGRNEDARKEHEIIGKHFTKNGFYLKAIAVYKQLQKLFPADISLSITLAELNEKHGLVANALSEYKLVYEYHEKAGNIPAMLDILNRMQTVDTQNIAIKVKLAETYSQHGKQEDSYTTFGKVVALLLERGDNATLSKICARIHQLFPKKPDFMLEILTEQIRQGNAASAIESIQGLLRSNPNNKQAWDLLIRAYELLGQPQRVKTVFQHYLKFFPEEPCAIHGLITSATADGDLAGALELLDKYESTLISAGFLEQLEQTYHSLDKIDPINIRILEGLIRVVTAAGNEKEARSLTLKLQSLRSVSGSGHFDSPSPESVTSFSDDSIIERNDTFDEPRPFDENLSEPPAIHNFATPEEEVFPQPATAPEPFDASACADWQSDESIEIDIDFDAAPSFASEGRKPGDLPTQEHWLDSVDTLLDAIDTAPSGVKFGNALEDSDAQAHFDLGLAFKEMGLIDEAIKEFRQASQDASRRVECLVLQCACLRERGELDKSIAMLQTLLKPELNKEESCEVKYELAIGYEAAGKNDEAHHLINEIHAVNPDFRDIRSRINEVSISESLDFSDDDLKDF